LSYNTRILLSNPEPLFRFGWRQVVLAGHNLSTCLTLKFHSGTMGNPAAIP